MALRVTVVRRRVRSGLGQKNVPEERYGLDVAGMSLFLPTHTVLVYSRYSDDDCRYSHYCICSFFLSISNAHSYLEVHYRRVASFSWL